MHIYGPTQVHGPQGVNAPHTARAPQAADASRPQSVSDQLDLSEAARLASQLSEVPEIRQERVAAIRAAIAAGTYETDARLSGAVDRLLDEIG
jgi:negative regulator of flagellin synthesis FlgM